MLTIKKLLDWFNLKTFFFSGSIISLYSIKFVDKLAKNTLNLSLTTIPISLLIAPLILSSVGLNISENLNKHIIWVTVGAGALALAV